MWSDPDVLFMGGIFPVFDPCGGEKATEAITNSIFQGPVFVTFSWQCYRCYRMLFWTDNILLIYKQLFLLAFSRLVTDVIDVIGTFAFGIVVRSVTFTANYSMQFGSLCATPACSRRSWGGGIATTSGVPPPPETSRQMCTQMVVRRLGMIGRR